MILTLTQVFDVEPWDSQHGRLWSVSGFFDNGDYFTVNKKQQADAEALRARLETVIDVPQDFTLEDAGTTSSGKQKWKIKGFRNVGAAAGPGPEAPGATGPSAAAPVPTYYDEEPDRIRRATALKDALLYSQQHRPGSLEPDAVVAIAREFELYLSGAAVAASPSLEAAPAPDDPPAGSGTGVPPDPVGTNEPEPEVPDRDVGSDTYWQDRWGGYE